MQVRSARAGEVTPTMITLILGIAVGVPLVMLVVYFRRAKAAA